MKLEQGDEKYGHVRRLREVITDHGSEFYANKRDNDGTPSTASRSSLRGITR